MHTTKLAWQCRGLLFAAATLLAGGCAHPLRRVVDVPLPSIAQPGSGPIVAIVEVVDHRSFVHESPDPADSQLITGGEDDRALTARSFGQFTTAGGRRFCDFLLPEGRSVEGLVRASLASGLRLAGFRVVEPGEEVPEAIPVSAEIRRLWTWNTGTWTFAFHFASEVAIRAAITPFETTSAVQGSALLHSAVAGSDHAYANTATKGLEDFVENLRRALRQADASTLPR